MATYRIAIYPGDGIGTEVTTEALRTLKSAAALFGFELECTEFPWGCAYAQTHNGNVVPEDFLATLADYDAIFLGAVGLPDEMPDHVTLVPLIRMRQGFEQYICLRPAKLLPGVTTPLANKQPGDIDIVVVRENSEGEYTGTGGLLKEGTPDELALQTAIHTRKGVERILRFGFELARKRTHRLTMATKSNALNFAMVLWDRVLDEVAPDYPDVEAGKMHIDAMTMQFVRAPEMFDVVVASNLFGDILSDLAGGLVGSLGLAPSANINPSRQFPSLFEPVHGSAPDIAGKGIANPIAAIRSVAMMLDFLGESQAAQALEQAVIENLSEARVATPDLGGTASTAEVGTDIVSRLSQAR